MTETGNEKVGGFGVGGDVKVQTSKVGKFSRRYGTTVCEFKNTRFLHGTTRDTTKCLPSRFSSDRGSLDKENAEIEIAPFDNCLRPRLRPKTELFPPPPEFPSLVQMSSF